VTGEGEVRAIVSEVRREDAENNKIQQYSLTAGYP